MNDETSPLDYILHHLYLYVKSWNHIFRTANLEAMCKTADILVVAIGRAEMVKVNIEENHF